MFSLTLVTPQKKIVEGAQLKEVFIPAFRGEIEILPGHAPLITTLTEGVVKYRIDGTEELKAVAISWGYCEVTVEGEVNILAETAETPEEIDLKRAEDSRQLALDRLANVTFDEFDEYQKRFMRAEARITAKKDHH